MIPDLRDQITGLQPLRVQEYLRSRGWKPQEVLEGRYASYANEVGVIVDVPLTAAFADYARRLSEAVGLLAAAENRGAEALLDDLSRPAGDLLGVRVTSEATRSGTMPLEQALQLRTATRSLLLSAAHSVLSPEAYFPRLSRKEATTLLASVREGQSARGSYVARFIVPTPADPQLTLLSDEHDASEPFERRATSLLVQALAEVHRVRSLGSLNELMNLAPQGVSGNLLAALSTMRAAIGDGSVSFEMTWARNRRAPRKASGVLEFPSEALEGLDAVAEELKSRGETKGFRLFGYVNRLQRGGEAAGPGNIAVLPRLSDLGNTRIHLHLDEDDYDTAIEAHRTGQEISVVGTLRKEGRRWQLADVSGFQLLPPDSDDDGANDA